MLSHDVAKSGGLLWLNAAETMIDVEDGQNAEHGKHTHWCLPPQPQRGQRAARSPAPC
jgi:hypothetical protein